MKKSIVICAFLFPFASFSQVDLSIDSVFHRMGVGTTYYPDGLEYFYVPDFYSGNPIELSAVVSNLGTDTAHNVHLTVDVFNSQNSLISSHNNSTIDLCGGCSDTIYTTTPFIGPFDYTMTFNYDVSSDEIDSNPTNNLDATFTKISSSSSGHELRRDTDTLISSIDSISGFYGQPICFGNEYELLESAYFNSVEMYIDSSYYTNDLIYSIIYLRQPGDSTWYWINQTSDYTLLSGDIGEWVELYLDPEFSLCNGDKIFVAACSYSGMVKFGLSQQTDDSTSWAYGYNFSGEVWQSLNKAVMCHPKIEGASCGSDIGENEYNALTFQIAPNPSTHSTNIQYQLQSNAVVELTLSDLSGRQIRNVVLGNQLSGSYNYTLDITDLQSGVYLVTLQVGDQQKSQKLIISK